MLTSRPYGGGEDLAHMQDAVAEWKERDPCGYLHPGDLPHRIYNVLRRDDPTEVVRLWDGSAGLAAFCIVSSRDRAFDVQAAPDRGDALAAAVEWAEATLREAHGAGLDKFAGDVWECDTAYLDLLTGRGYRAGRVMYAVTGRRLDDLPPMQLPDGFAIRSVRGVEEAAAVAEVHARSFDSEWTVDQYRRVMESPGYDAERELVVEAPDGRLAGFTIIWFDPRNRDGLFEPVGVHEDFRRLGLGRALLAAGMARMREAGMETATVWHDFDDPASTALYANAGFRRRGRVVDVYRTLRPAG